MSRIGNKPIELPAGVSVSISPGRVMVNGPLGELSQSVPQRMSVEQRDGELVALHGLTRSLVANMVEGVTKGFEKALEIQGVGYRAGMRGADLELNVGYSHPVVKKAPLGITFEVPAPNQILVKGIDKQRVGQVAAEVRAVRPPEPYKGKGIRYAGEYVRRKIGKRA
jgi:large subunit ribosomal protein L6